jgi:hypothetical protein
VDERTTQADAGNLLSMIESLLMWFSLSVIATLPLLVMYLMLSCASRYGTRVRRGGRYRNEATICFPMLSAFWAFQCGFALDRTTAFVFAIAAAVAAGFIGRQFDRVMNSLPRANEDAPTSNSKRNQP